jgi:hypothetical protein
MSAALQHTERADLATPLACAIRYADRGWPVFPLYEATAPGVCACKLGGSCGRDTGKHPRTLHGLSDATTEAQRITGWWQRWPSANVGIATGSASGLIVADIDPRHGGGASLVRIQREHGALPRTATVRTGGDGAHLYYKRPAGRSVRSRCPLLGYSGLDLKAEGGYVAAPPSRHASGRRYAWHSRERIADAPEWLLDLAAQEPPRPVFDPPRTARSRSDLDDALRRCPRVRARFERRTDGLHDTSPSGVDLGLASGLALLGFDADAIAHAITESRTRAGLPPKRPSYVRSTVRKALGVRA